MSEPRRHHLLPQFYMRAFATDRERVSVVPRVTGAGPRKPYASRITNVLVERDFYTIADEAGEESFIVEEAYAELESAAAQAMRVLLEDGLELSDNHRAHWSEFMALQVTRGRAHREMVDRMTDQILKAGLGTAATNAPDEYFEQISSELVALGEEPLPEMTAEQRKLLTDHNSFAFTASKEQAIDLSFAAIDQLTSMFYEMAWKLIRFPEPCLLTSDHPVSYWREPGPHNQFLGIGPMTAREVRIPLSPSAALVLTWPPMVDDTADAEHEGDLEMARCLNRDLLKWPPSKQWLISPDVATHPLPATEREWTAEWPRPWLESERYHRTVV